MGGRRAAAAGLVAVGALLAGAATLAAPEAAPRAAPAPRLVAALEEAPLVVVGRVASVERLDRHGMTASLAVERALAGQAEGGATLRFAWEELAESRAPRFAAGERVLVALQPLAGTSLWRQRLPDPAVRARTLAVAERDEAFLREPSLGSLAVLEHYLALAPDDRAGPLGAERLAALAAHAEAPLAASAVRRLAGLPAADEALDASSAAQLVDALARPEEGLRREVVELAATRRPEALRAALEARAAADPLATPELFEALARLRGELPEPLRRRLAAEGSEAHRQVAVRFAGGASAASQLAERLRHDPSAEVRSAALQRLVELEGEAALDDALAALGDRAAEVRLTAAQVLGRAGEAAVPRLRDVALGWPAPAPEAAVLALGLSDSAEATRVLRVVAEEHPDEAVRRLADLALRRDVGHRH